MDDRKEGIRNSNKGAKGWKGKKHNKSSKEGKDGRKKGRSARKHGWMDGRGNTRMNGWSRTKENQQYEKEEREE